MQKFNYFHFPTLKYSQIFRAMGYKSDEEKLGRIVWDEWFTRKSHLFYGDQLHQHRNRLTDEFMRRNKISEIEDSEMMDKFNDFLDMQGYSEHEAKTREWQGNNCALPSDIIYSSMDFWEDGDMAARSLSGRSLLKLVPAWFNSVIEKTTKQEQKESNLTYPEYLNTRHWHKVRAATILVFGANCIGKPCEWNRGEGMWYAYSHHRQVHHLSYYNKGGERFGDVCVLCADCHTKLHKTDEVILDENSITDFLSSQF